MLGKAYYELTDHELRDHPIWVLAQDAISYGGGVEDGDDDTSLVIPMPTDPAVMKQLFDNCICYVRATFIAADGTRFVGLMCSKDGDGVESTQPAIIAPGGQVDFYLGSASAVVLDPERIAANYTQLGTKPEKLFPLEYMPDVPIPGGSPGGVLNGFYYMDRNTIQFVR